MTTPQRLVVCLDGTWNNRDDNTNVLHHHNLVVEGTTPDGWQQKRYYDTGVGTGVLDSITGGGFGIGLEANVREAYNWLVENFNDHGEGDDYVSDEIYIFGFSRGAFTARSLVGLISRCGLLRRGAPLTVTQLWGTYGQIGRQRERRRSLWDHLLPEPRPEFRELSRLIRDPWPADAGYAPAGDPPAPDFLPGQLRACHGEAESLLIRWSRRVRITYLGIYDTVGAMGIDALAIPTLTSKLALQHNMRPTSLIRRCRHALAIDEHRSSFERTPFRAFIQHGQKPRDWSGTIEQRWFVGAHSNIGGSYGNNRLAQRPFEWVLEGATTAPCHLHCLPLHRPRGVASPLPAPRDSFADFARPLWSALLRAKRNFRRLDPPAEVRASSRKNRNSAGYSLRNIHETIDESVATFYQETNHPIAANLLEWLNRTRNPPLGAPWDTLARRQTHHAWLGAKPLPYAWLIVWGAFTAFGFEAAWQLFALGPLNPLWLPAIAAGFILVDAAESLAVFRNAIHGETPGWRAIADSVYWTRVFGVIFFVLGFAASLVTWFHLGWQAGGLAGAREIAWSTMEQHLGIAAGALGGGLLALFLDRDQHSLFPLRGAVMAFGALAFCAIVALGVGVGWAGSLLLAPLAATAVPPVDLFHPTSTSGTAFAGALLLVQVTLFYFVRSFIWCADPMRRANLGSIVWMQLRPTAAGVEEQLERWRQRLEDKANPADRGEKFNGPAAKALRRTLLAALHRDSAGFVPVCGITAWCGLWFTQHPHLAFMQPPLPALGPAPAYLWIPVALMLFDWSENLVHLAHLRRHQDAKPVSRWLAPIGFLASFAKFALILPLLALVLFSGFIGTLLVAGMHGGWRESLCIVIGLTAFFVAAAALAAIVLRALPKSWR